MADSVFELTLKKEILRGELEDKVTKLGTGHPDVLAINKKLDSIVIQLQRRLAG